MKRAATGMDGFSFAEFLNEIECFYFWEIYVKYDDIILKFQLLLLVIVRFDALLLNGGQVHIPNERHHVCE